MAEAARRLAINPDLSRLGDDIRQLRRVRNVTLQELAERTGKSIGFLSQIERNRSKPSVATLQAISEALGVHIGWFFPAEPAADAGERRYVVRRENRRRLAYSELSNTDYLEVQDYLLSANLNGNLAFGYSRYAPKSSTGDDCYAHRGEEAGLVVSGALELTVGQDTYNLREGDAFSFPSHLPHRFANPSETEDLVVVWANTPITLRP